MNISDNPQYLLKDSGEFVITDYNSAKLFSNFLPGIAGKNGIPMWVFYVNRGQSVCSMGIEGKHNPIMEFLPVNRACQLVTTQGFRTFVKLRDHKSESVRYYEPFQKHIGNDQIRSTQRMIISPSQLILEETNHTLGLKFSVKYFNVPQDNYAGLIRVLSIENINHETITVEGLDGLPLIIPYGIDNTMLKNIRRLVEAFVEVVNYDRRVPYFRAKIEPVDRPEVVKIKEGNFYLAFESEQEQPKLITPIADPHKIFGTRSDYSYPENFIASDDMNDLTEGQIFENRYPCAMGLFRSTIDAGKTYTLSSVIGHACSTDQINNLIPEITADGYIKTKTGENQRVIDELMQNNFICSQESALDHYARQNYLDNVLRGGFPATLTGGRSPVTLYLYSRKHGDLERDYNDFRLSPTKYSQGNGNYRDVNQNRRCDLFINPDIAESNVEHFYNLIQLDGFNPLVIKVTCFTLTEKELSDKILKTYIDEKNLQSVKDFLQMPFTPGTLMGFLDDQQISVQGSFEALLCDLTEICDREHDTEHLEGFWTDHWTYNLDLLENYLAVYPEKCRYILFDKKSFTFYDNAHCVQPRCEKYVLWEGKAMQFGAVVFDEEKGRMIKKRRINPNEVRTGHGQGDIYFTTLINKILCLLTNKLASLDPEGVGVEMEADKPNWYDALNGLPGLMGSSISETIEIKRNILFLTESFDQMGLKDEKWLVFEELKGFMNVLNDLCRDQLTPFDFWEKAATAKEQFREKTRLGISGKEVIVTPDEVRDFFEAGLSKLNQGIQRAWSNEKNVLSTYFINEATDFQKIKITEPDGTEQDKCNEKGLPCFRAKKFRQIHLPLFLEGPVHYLRCIPDRQKARTLVHEIKKSGLFDTKLNMYKVNETLADQPMEIGRNRVFSPGWFENESIWLHMEYKYMLEILRNELYAEFYQDFKQVFVPFLNPEVYGRSILEVSSFIVSSANPDPSIHGTGFTPRLSGATAEFIHILLFMTVGQKPFSINDKDELRLCFAPALPDWLFTKDQKTIRLHEGNQSYEVILPANTFSFMFLGKTLVTYHNPDRKDTFGVGGVSPVSYTVKDYKGNTQHFSTDSLDGKIAADIRNREIQIIDIELG